MAPSCFSCKTELELGSVVGRNETCPKCDADVRVCLNCKHYASDVYNECKETQAERVLDKDRANFCDYFAIGEGHAAEESSKAAALKKLDDLFK